MLIGKHLATAENQIMNNGSLNTAYLSGVLFESLEPQNHEIKKAMIKPLDKRKWCLVELVSSDVFETFTAPHTLRDLFYSPHIIELSYEVSRSIEAKDDSLIIIKTLKDDKIQGY